VVEVFIAEQNMSSLESDLNVNVCYYDMTMGNAYLSNDRENPRLVIVIPIRSDAEIDLLGEIIRLVRGRELENAVGNAAIKGQEVNR
jgi:hypothetical protein